MLSTAALGSHQRASAASDPTGSDLLAAVATPAEIQSAVPGAWSQVYPLFEVPGRATRDYQANWVRSASLDVHRIDSAGTVNGLVYTRVELYRDDGAAKAAYASSATSDADGTTAVPGMGTLGDESRAFTSEFPVANAPEDGYRMETFVRYRSGRIIGIVDSQLPAYLSASQLGPLAKPVAARSASVLSGALTAPTLSATLAAVMPPASFGTLVGPLMGQAELTPDTYSWGFADSGLELARVKSLGVTSVGYQVYAASAVTKHVLTVTVLPLKDEAAARDYVLFDDAELKTPSLNTIPTGATGAYSVFRKFDAFDNYDYQMARNRYVVILTCTPRDAEASKVSDDCLVLTRTAAEAIYASLPAGKLTPTATPSPATTATAAPLPPKTGSGSASASAARSIFGEAGLVLLVVGASAAIWFFSTRRA